MSIALNCCDITLQYSMQLGPIFFSSTLANRPLKVEKNNHGHSVDTFQQDLGCLQGARQLPALLTHLHYDGVPFKRRRLAETLHARERKCHTSKWITYCTTIPSNVFGTLFRNVLIYSTLPCRAQQNNYPDYGIYSKRKESDRSNNLNS